MGKIEFTEEMIMEVAETANITAKEAHRMLNVIDDTVEDIASELGISKKDAAEALYVMALLGETRAGRPRIREQILEAQK